MGSEARNLGAETHWHPGQLTPPGAGGRRLAPLFRWPGGKRWLVPTLLRLTPAYSGRYFEPFLGGGALFFALQPERATLADTNTDLVACYQAIREDHQRVAAELARLSPDEATYYTVRASAPRDRFGRAARLIYLTSLAFNGIHRVNRRGEFNVPYGGRQYAWLGHPSLLQPYAAGLSTADLRAEDFEVALSPASQGDLVYLDPPYTVAHSNNGFVKYNDSIFSWKDQQRLAALARDLAERGCLVIISNAYHESIRQLYPTFGAAMVSRNSVMAADPSKRGRTKEYVLTSFPIDQVALDGIR